MSITNLLALLLGLLLMGGIAWFFWGPRMIRARCCVHLPVRHTTC
jgi:hypothetical protein